MKTMEIDAKTVMKLRSETDAGMMECKKALQETAGDFSKAKELLKKWGQVKVEKLADRAAVVGAIGAYVHNTGKVGALIELACNTDLVAKNAEFQELLRELAIGVVAFNPKWVSKDQVPKDLVDEEKKKFEAEVKGKPPQIAEKILEGKLEKNLFSQACLLSMPFPKEDMFKGTYGEYLKSKIAKLGENIVLRRYVRMELGT
ncbi:MAG: elongation factor Ts [Planctomycetes bacterium]|nr:elongation factor Ts [Planctomycetota bacterium]